MSNEAHWKDSNALVTGGASFIGSHLVDALVSRGVNVTVLDDLSSGKLDNLSQSLHKVKFVTHNLEYNAKDVLKTIFKEQLKNQKLVQILIMKILDMKVLDQKELQ